jgi:hypothetical protein
VWYTKRRIKAVDTIFISRNSSLEEAHTVFNERKRLREIREALLTQAYKDARRENRARSASERMTRLNADPAFAAARSERMTRLHKDPAFAADRDKRLSRLNADPAFAADRDKRSSERMIRLHKDPAFAADRDKRSSERMIRLNAQRSSQQRRESALKAWETRRRHTAPKPD